MGIKPPFQYSVLGAGTVIVVAGGAGGREGRVGEGLARRACRGIRPSSVVIITLSLLFKFVFPRSWKWCERTTTV